ncbi:MAG: helix-turn-helix transcriptional regulator [Coriobacteriales bacterium]|jgi:DNA-binding CsgD family transcriptional regulator|nr:helix-turn-helix transcriptional regulator [Coriobacteriales bacterium]
MMNMRQQIPAKTEPTTELTSQINDGVTSQPKLKYLGLTTLLAWHYCLWFVANIFPDTFLLDDAITFSWLINLSSSAVVLFALPRFLGKNRHLCDYPIVLWLSCICASAGTLIFTLIVSKGATLIPAYLCSACLGISSALLWLLWAERYAQVKAHFSIRHIAPSYGICFLVSLILASILPPVLAAVWVALLPLISGSMLYIKRSDAKLAFPILLPESSVKRSMQSIGIVCLISFISCTTCYFFVAIVPWELLVPVEDSFAYGVYAGALFILALALLGTIAAKHFNIFTMFNWLLVLTALVGVMYLTGEFLYFSSFIVALMIVSVFEILIAIYFARLTQSGYASPQMAFGLAGGSIRLGVAVGNTLAILYERLLDANSFKLLVPLTALVLIVLTVSLLIPLVRQEYNIISATSKPTTSSETDTICTQIAKEFALSCRETEIITLIAHGYNAAAVAEKLVISTNTVNTHIAHIYSKIGIHKRKELFSYINRHGC